MALYFPCGKTSGPKATRDYSPAPSALHGSQRKDKVNQLIANIEKCTQRYLIDRNEDKFTKEIIQHVNVTREFFKKQPKWQKILDDIANTIIQLFNKVPLQTDFSFFANPATKENLDKLETLLKPKC